MAAKKKEKEVAENVSVFDSIIEQEFTEMQDLSKVDDTVDYYVDTCHEYELGVYRGEVERLASEGKLSPEDIPFIHIVNAVDVVPKSMIPDNSLMWEFVDKE